LIAALSIVLAKVLQMVGSRFVSTLLERTGSDMDDVLFEELHAPLYITVFVGGLYIATLPLQLPLHIDSLLQASALSLIVIIWTRTVIRTGNRFFTLVQESERDYEFVHIFENIWTFIVLIVALFSLLAIWEIDVTPLLASAGVAGVVIGFAAKDAVANLFGGIALFFDDTYKVGDYIVLDSGDAGTVVDIGIRSTTIVTRDEVMVTIPNAVLNSSKVINESNPRERKRVTVPIGIAYGSNIDEFEDIVLEIAENDDFVLGHPSPRIRFREFGDSALKYDLLCWVEEPLRDVKAVHSLNRKIYKALNAAGIEIPYPKRDVYMRQEAAEEARERDQDEIDTDEVATETPD
jgi:small-conductance mechanosensitive channel